MIRWHSSAGLCLTAAVIGLACLLAAPGTAAACPMCKAALASAEGGGDLVQGFFWSILFMLSMPFTILGVFSGCMYVAVRRARAAQAAQPVLQNAVPAGNHAVGAERELLEV